MRLRSSLTRLNDRLHEGAFNNFLFTLCAAALFIIVLAVHYKTLSLTNPDYNIFASWYDFARQHGWGSLKYGYSDGFSNYNPPYNYLLIFVSYLPLSKLVAIKGLMLVFDLLMAAGVYMVLRALSGERRIVGKAGIAALASLLLPTVIFNGAIWGQFDQLYTAFLLFSLYGVITEKSKLAWICFGVAIAIKLQAIFFLPLLVVFSMRRIRLFDSVWAVAAFIALTLPPLLFGRSLGSLLKIYTDQTQLFHSLALNVPNPYVLIPNTFFDVFNSVGVLMTLAVLIGAFVYAVYHQKFSNRDAIISGAIFMYLVPFLLPQMHERYFFAGTVFMFVLAWYIPKLLWVSVVMQIVTLFTYMPFLFGAQPPVNFSLLAVIAGVMLYRLIFEYVQPLPGRSVAQTDNRLSNVVRRHHTRAKA